MSQTSPVVNTETNEIELPPQLDAIDKQLRAVLRLALAFCDAEGAECIGYQLESARAQLRAMAHTSQLISAGLRAKTAPSPSSAAVPPTFGGVVPPSDSNQGETHDSPIDRL